MPVKFKNYHPASENDLANLGELVRKELGSVPNAEIVVGFSRTTLRIGGYEVVIPVGVPAVKDGKAQEKLVAAREYAKALLGMGLPGLHDGPQGVGYLSEGTGAPVPKKTPHGAPAKPYDDMTDEEWVEAVAGELFPGVIHLYTAKALYQPVLGTSSGSIYRTCFIGPDLKVAARIKNGQVSFRATTSSNTCPSGPLKAIFERLGVTSEYEDRLTCHASMSGPYDADHAGEYRALFGAFYAALRPWVTSGFPAIGKLAEGVK